MTPQEYWCDNTERTFHVVEQLDYLKGRITYTCSACSMILYEEDV